MRHITAVQRNAPRGRPCDAGEQIEERRLARAVRSDDDEKLARPDVERDIVDDRRAADPQAEARGRQQRCWRYLNG
jgi:hypothetical protein